MNQSANRRRRVAVPTAFTALATSHRVRRACSRRGTPAGRGRSARSGGQDHPWPGAGRGRRRHPRLQGSALRRRSDRANRFKAPRQAAPPGSPPPTPPSSARPASRWRPATAPIPTTELSKQIATIFTTSTEMKIASEDCLFLNVWTPGRRGQERPVMVWLHGGGFAYGSGSLAGLRRPRTWRGRATSWWSR